MLLVLSSACTDDDAPPASTPLGIEERAAVEAFTRYWDEAVAIANAGRVPQNAFVTTATGVLREQEITRLARDARRGATRTGEPELTQHRVSVSGDFAVVVACINEDDWTYSLPGREPIHPDSGWWTVGRELTKVDGEWLVSDYSPASSRDSCD